MSGFVSEVRTGRNPFVVRLAFIAALGGLLFGYDTGVISGALLYIKADLGASNFDQQAVVGSLLLGAMAGAAVAGWSADRYSRKRTILVAGLIYIVGALASAFSQTIAELIISRFVLGLAVGTASFVAPLYIAELAPPRIRGGLVSFNQLMIVSGILVAYIANFALKGLADNWRWMLGLGALPGIALAIGMLTQPFSPRWLVEHGREDEAREVLRRARSSHEEVEDEIGEIREVASQERKSRLRDLLSPGVRQALIVGLGLAAFQQLIGVNTVIYYAPTILSYTGLSAGSAVTQTVFVGVTNLVFTIVAVVLLDRFGRRAFLFAGTAGCIVALTALGIFFASSSLQHSAKWIALAALIVYIASFAVGLGPVFWLMISEIFPLKVRGPAMAVSTVTNWGFNFLVSFTFLTLVSAVTKEGTFWIYAGIGVLAMIFYARFVPETKQRSLEEIEDEMGAETGDATTKEPGPSPRLRPS